MIKKLRIVYVVPARYDDEGYVQRYFRGVVPSNSLAVLTSLTREMAERNPFPGVEIDIIGYDDSVQRVPIEKIARMNRQSDTKVIVGFVGVQTGQFPRAVDLALRLKKLGVKSMIGGFHVTGVMALFDELPAELKNLLENGITIIQGECETPGVLENLFRDVLEDKLQPIYAFPKAPDIENVALPVCDKKYIKKFAVKWATMDSSRGCPYGCTFCTVINIQGRKMRCRSAQGVLKTLRENHKNGVDHFFFTDDNFARSRIWNDVFDGLIQMREEGMNFSFMMQVDTQSSKIPNFVEKAQNAGCRMVFVGMESVNPANIAAAGKSQNSVDQYRTFVQAWQKSGILVHVGYIIGFPNDTLESIKTDVAFLRDHVCVDEVSFFMLTPLPGSVDHRDMVLRGDPLDPDFNKYDSFHETYKHPKMLPGEWMKATQLAYSEFYTKENIVRILRRIPKENYWHMFVNFIWYRYSGVYNGTHPMMTGVFRQKDRLDRREGFPKESIAAYVWRRTRDCLRGAGFYFKLFFEFQEIWLLTRQKAKSPISVAEITGAATIPLNAGSPQVVPGRGSRYLPEGTKQLKVLAGWGADNWKRLVELRDRWFTVKQHVAEFNWSGQVQAASQELQGYLGFASRTLKSIAGQLNKETAKSRNRKATKLESVAGEVDEMLTQFDNDTNDPNMLDKFRTFIEEQLLGRFEEMSYRYVKTRRRANLWRRNAVNNLKKGRVLRFTGSAIIRSPFIAVQEIYLAMRFGIAAFRKEV